MTANGNLMEAIASNILRYMYYTFITNHNKQATGLMASMGGERVPVDQN